MFPQKLLRRHKLVSSLLTCSLASLLCYGLIDEIYAGLLVVGLPLMRDQFRIDYIQVGLLFTVSAISSMLLDPVISLLSDRGSKRFWILGGLLMLLLTVLLQGFAPNYWILLLAFMLGAPATDAAIGLAQAALIDHSPDESTRVMTRWTLLSGIGDALGPLLVTLLAALSLGWSSFCLLAATLWGLLALTNLLLPFPEPAKHEQSGQETEEGETASMWQTLGKAVRNPELLRWAFLTKVPPTMVDEIFLGFAALYLHDVVGLNQIEIGAMIIVAMVGSLLALLLLDRLTWLRNLALRSPQRLLAMTALLVLLAVLLLLSVRNIWLIGLAMFLMHLGSACWYPIAKARAYDQLPGRSGMVRAVMGLGSPLEMALPAVVGFIAGQFGILAGLALLGSAPVLILLGLVGYRKK
jgi:FSR family fosmidomycin resistance protein-like MFS transporter